MKIGIIGLGKMGAQIARKLGEQDHEVVAFDSNPEAKSTVGSLEELVKSFGDQQVVLWLMIPSEVIESELPKLLGLVPKGSIIIDGGNSDYRLTVVRAKTVAEAGSQLVDVGTSGGVWGYDNGFSMMVGGDAEAFKVIEPILETLAKPEGAYHYFGPSGSGHFVKMVHNGVEYGMMESLAEGYRVLKDGPYRGLDLAAAADVWQHHSVVTSWLNELTRDALKVNPNLDGIEGVVAETGEARWTLEIAKELGMDLPAIQAALDVRVASQNGQINFATKLLAAMRNGFGGHNLNKS